MKSPRRQPAARAAPSFPSPQGVEELRARLAAAEVTLQAIQRGEVDAVVVAGKTGPQVYTLEGAGQAYRVLIESMNEGALTLTADAVILYANQCFAKMVQLPLEKVMSGSFHRFLSSADQAAIRPLLKRAAKSGTKIQAWLRADHNEPLPVLISLRPLAKPGAPGATLGVVVTDMSEARRTEERLQALSHRLVEVQETERRRVAIELHENISQLTFAILMRCETLAAQLPAPAHAARAELLKLRDLLNQATEEVRRIARNLRPSALDDLGLLPVLRTACAEFAAHAHVQTKLTGGRQIGRLSAVVETALYRIFQEVLRNVAQHAQAQHLAVSLRLQHGFVCLAITDDGVGFNTHLPSNQRQRTGSLGLLSMRERAASVGGTLHVQSAPGQGTTIQARIPLDNIAPRRRAEDAALKKTDVPNSKRL